MYVSRETLRPVQCDEPDFRRSAEAKVEPLATDAFRGENRNTALGVPAGQEPLLCAG